jgi:ribosomal subunit interface protein
MRVQITARHCELPDVLRARTEALVQKLQKYDSRVSAAEIVFEEERHAKKVEAVLSVDRDEPVVAGGQGDDFAAALDQMVDRLSKILRRRRSQVRDHQARPLAEELAGE